MEKTPFKHCPKCHNKYAQKDKHDVCNLCLEDGHDEDGCEACREFVPKTLRTRRRQRIAHKALQGGSPQRHKMADLGLSSDEEEAEMAEDISDESEEDIQLVRPHSTPKTPVDEGAQTSSKVKTFKITLPKDRRSEKTMATPKASTISKPSTPVVRPKTKEPQGPSPKDTEAGKPSRPTPRRGQEKDQERVDAEGSRPKRLDVEKISTPKRVDVKGSAPKKLDVEGKGIGRNP